jgi:two-component system, NarL family, response regulator DesR
MTTSTPCPLTPRELAALRAVAGTGGGKLAARKMGITENTLKNHLNTIHHKLGTGSTAQAAVYAVERNWLKNVTLDANGSEP